MSRREQVRALVLAALLVVSSVSVAGVGAATPSSSNPTFHVSQGDLCAEITPIGSGDKTVEEFYDYRAGEGTQWGSYGDESQAIQENQVSHLFVYHGSEGLSLVMLHDELNESEGGAITFDITGLPENREWAVEDDDYPGRDDNFQHDGTQSTIDWMWAPERSDGAAVRGLSGNFDAITIEPAFGEESWAHQERDRQWPYSTDEITDWEVESGDGSTVPLSKDQQVSIAKGECPDETGLDASFSASPNPAANDETVTFDASASSGDIDSYEWDLGDGTTKTGEVIEHSYTKPGDYTATLTVKDGAGNSDTAMKTITVEEDSPEPPKDSSPSAKLSLTKQTVDFSQKVGFDATASSDDGDIVEYRWDFDGDGEVDRTTPDENAGKNADPAVVWHDVYTIYDEPGEYTATVTVVDDDGNTDTATKTITVEQNDKTPPSATLHVPDTVEVGEEFTVKATHFTESDLAHVCWVFDDHDAPEGATASYTFEEPGDKEVTLHLVDRAGNSNMLTATITVEAPDSSGDGSSDDKPDEGGLDNNPNRGSTGGSVPSATPSGSNDDSTDDSSETSAALDGTAGQVGEIVLRSSATTPGIEVTSDAPADVREPTVDRDGFAALSYVTVSGPDSAEATFTVSKDRLDEMDAGAEDVTLFRFQDGTWSAVETERLDETDDAIEFRADAEPGTFAVGIDRPSTGVADLSVEDSRVEPGEAATVVVTVENDGRASGTHEVELTADGEVVATQSVSVPAGETRQVEFAPAFDDAGVYEVSAGDANAELVVEGIETTEAETTTEMDGETTTDADEGADVPGFGVGAALTALAAAALLARRLH